MLPSGIRDITAELANKIPFAVGSERMDIFRNIPP